MFSPKLGEKRLLLGWDSHSGARPAVRLLVMRIPNPSMLTTREMSKARETLH